MTEPRPPRPSFARTALQTFAPLGLLALVLLYAVGKRTRTVLNPDTFFHLRLGDEFLGGWSASSPGSVTRFANAEWLPTQWLGQVGLAWTEDVWGMRGVAVVTGLAITALLTLYFVIVRRHTSPGVAVMVVAAAFLASAPFLSGRPQVFSYAFTALVTAGWLRTARGGRIPYWIVPLTWLWAMLHGMWSVGIIVSGAAILGLALDRRVSISDAWKHLSVPVLSLAAGCLTPVGPGLLSSVARVGAISEYFSEWGPVDFHTLASLMGLALVGTLVLVGLRRGQPTAWTPIVLTALAAAWLVYSARTVPTAVAMLVPLVAVQVATVRPTVPRHRIEAPLLAAVVGIAVAACFVNSAEVPADPRGESLAHASVDDLPAGTALLNDWGEGGYDMWRHRDLDIVMHGYGDMFTDEELERNDDIGSLEPGWYDSVTEMGVDHALVRKGGRLAAALVTDKGWTVVAEDEGAPAEDPGTMDAPMVHLEAPRS